MLRRRRVLIELYVTLTALLAAVIIVGGLTFHAPDLTRTVIATALVLTLASMLLEFVDFPLVIGGVTSISTITFMASVFLLPFPIPAIVGLVAVLVVDLRERHGFQVMLFNSTNFAISMGISSFIWHITYGRRAFDELPLNLWALSVVVVVIVVFYGANVMLTNGIIAISSNRSLRYIWLTNDFDVVLPYMSLQVIGALVALVWTTTPVLTPLLLLPAITTYIAFEMIHRLRLQTLDAMLAMADAIDRRDPYTADHSRRVADLAVLICNEQGINERDTERIRIAARLHDIGKIGIGNELLHKSGNLSRSEWDILRSHPVIGEQLLESYRQFRHSIQMVRHHHERWDGGGYPDALRGHDIPLGARVIAVADSFDAMITSRPYRPALSRQFAINEIRNGALTQFDPQIVASFLQVMDEASRAQEAEDVVYELDEFGERKVPSWFSS